MKKLKLYILEDDLFCYKAFVFAKDIREARKYFIGYTSIDRRNTIRSVPIKAGWITDAGGNG